MIAMDGCFQGGLELQPSMFQAIVASALPPPWRAGVLPFTIARRVVVLNGLQELPELTSLTGRNRP